MLARLVSGLLGVVVVLAITGCTNLWPHVEKRHGRSSSLVDFLYPNGEVPSAERERIPQLNLPLRVGVAFLPQSGYETLSPLDERETLDKVRAAFRDRNYIAKIDVIPQSYMRGIKGRAGLAQIGHLYNVDVMALIGFDQLAASDERDSALLYWTIVGAYVVKGTGHDVQTFIDMAVVDVATSSILMRAPGADQRKQNSTLSDSRRDMDQLRRASFALASEQMIAGLGTELALFEERVKSGDKQDVVVMRSDGTRVGGGSGDAWVLVMLAVFAWRQSVRGRAG